MGKFLGDELTVVHIDQQLEWRIIMLIKVVDLFASFDNTQCHPIKWACTASGLDNIDCQVLGVSSSLILDFQFQLNSSFISDVVKLQTLTVIVTMQCLQCTPTYRKLPML